MLCCLLAQLPCQVVEGSKFSQNLIVSSYELVSPLSHLIPTFACGECHFHAAFLNFITSRLSTAWGTAFQTARSLFCRARCKSLSSVTPHDCNGGGRSDSREQAGSLPAGWGCSWVVLGLPGWHRQAAVGKTGVWSSRASSSPWTNLQLSCNSAWCPVCPGLCCLFLGGK